MYKRKQKAICEQKETLQKQTREGAGPVLGSNKTNKEERESITEKAKKKADVFQRMFEGII